MAVAIADLLWNLQGLEIPLDVSHRIVSLLPVRDVCSLSSCSRPWRALCSSDFTWCILYQQRWRFLNTNSKTCPQEGSRKSDHLSIAGKAAFEGWRAEYVYVHKQMENGATSVIEHVKSRACHDSVEVAEYKKAMALLCSTGLEFQDVQMFLLAPKLSVLVNLLGLHYCLVHLKIEGKDVREALSKQQVGQKQVCLRWWSLGGWTNGFRRHDEMHMRVASLSDLIELGRGRFLEVIDRGTLHEVLRVQISADFKSSAWVARSMPSQR